MTVVVSDTSPLNYLVLIDNVSVLPVLFGVVVVPSAVFRELQHAETPEKVRAWVSSHPSWLKVKTSTQADRIAGLGEGETEAIALAQELNADLLLIDERKGTRAANAAGLKTAGTLAILDEADRRGLLDFEAAIVRLQNTSFHVHPVLLESILEQVRSRKSQN